MTVELRENGLKINAGDSNRQFRLILFYHTFWYVAVLLGLPLLLPLFLLSEKRRKTVFRRLWFKFPAAGTIRAPGLQTGQKPIWVHALSVGEVLSAVNLVSGLRQKFGQQAVIFSVSTQTGHEIALHRLKEKADAIFFFPYDISFAVKHAVERMDPSLVVIVETDIWPNFMREMKKRSIPAILVNARLSDRSFAKFKRFKSFSNWLFGNFAAVCTQSADDTGRFEQLGIDAERIVTTGNIKFDQDDRPVSGDDLSALKNRLRVDSATKLMVAGSTHNGEEVILRDTFLRLKKIHAELKLIVVPRNPKRARQIVQLFDERKIAVYLLSEFEKAGSGRSCEVIIVDRIGELAKLYALAHIAFVGGSLVRCGGHNPLEPAVFAKPLLFGPDMSDFRQISREMLDTGAAVTVMDSEELYRTVAELLGNEDLAARMGKQAYELFNSNKGALQKTLQVISAVYGKQDERKPSSERIDR